MGFFKKITKGVGKAIKKNVNFKTLVKVGSKFDPSGLVGGMQEQYYAKKEQKEYEAQLANQQGATGFVQMASMPVSNYQTARNPNFGEIMLGAAGGALAGAGGVLAGSTTAGQAGATLVDNTLMETLKKNWLKYLGILIAFVLVIVGLVKFVFKPKKRGKW